MGGPNLEVFKFGIYIMFPIGIMYYFGTNLESRFAVPDFWPKESQTHRLPYDREEIAEELERLKAKRLAQRARRLQMEAMQQNQDNPVASPVKSQMSMIPDDEAKREGSGKGLFGWFR